MTYEVEAYGISNGFFIKKTTIIASVNNNNNNNNNNKLITNIVHNHGISRFLIPSLP